MALLRLEMCRMLLRLEMAHLRCSSAWRCVACCTGAHLESPAPQLSRRCRCIE
jgi:hypothetical protein